MPRNAHLRLFEGVMMSETAEAIRATTYNRLNLGCGFDRRDGFINVDLNDFHGPDIVANISDLSDFPSGFYEEIIAQDVLEHMTREVSKKAFIEWGRLLSPTGVLKVRVPSLLGLLGLLHKHPWTAEAHNHIVHLMFGTQAYNGDFHLAGFTPPIFLEWAAEAGLMVASAADKDEWMYDMEFVKLREPTDEEFLHQLYFEVLGRSPDAGGFAVHLAELKRGRSRKIAREVFTSAAEAKI